MRSSGGTSGSSRFVMPSTLSYGRRVSDRTAFGGTRSNMRFKMAEWYRLPPTKNLQADQLSQLIRNRPRASHLLLRTCRGPFQGSNLCGRFPLLALTRFERPRAGVGIPKKEEELAIDNGKCG